MIPSFLFAVSEVWDAHTVFSPNPIVTKVSNTTETVPTIGFRELAPADFGPSVQGCFSLNFQDFGPFQNFGH